MSSLVAAPFAAFTAETRPARRVRRARSRAVAWAEIAALALITVALIAATIAGATRANSPVASERVRVERGQTLWELATQHPVVGLTTQQTADIIARLNHLEGGRLVSGAAIRIPVDSNDLLVACR